MKERRQGGREEGRRPGVSVLPDDVWQEMAAWLRFGKRATSRPFFRSLRRDPTRNAFISIPGESWILAGRSIDDLIVHADTLYMVYMYISNPIISAGACNAQR